MVAGQNGTAAQHHLALLHNANAVLLRLAALLSSERQLYVSSINWILVCSGH